VTLELVQALVERFPGSHREKLFLEQHGLDVDSIAPVNIAWCATEDNKYPKWMLSRCWNCHTASWLMALSPDIVIPSGSVTHEFEAGVIDLLPDCRVFETFHYAHRPVDKDRANSWADKLRKELGLWEGKSR